MKMRQLAKSQNKKISEYGVSRKMARFDFQIRRGIFAHFGLLFIPPSVREDGRETDRIEELPELVSIDDIKGDLHMHTTWSDGAHS